VIPYDAICAAGLHLAPKFVADLNALVVRLLVEIMRDLVPSPLDRHAGTARLNGTANLVDDYFDRLAAPPPQPEGLRCAKCGRLWNYSKICDSCDKASGGRGAGVPGDNAALFKEIFKHQRLATAFALLFVRHLSYAISFEDNYPSRPKIQKYLKKLAKDIQSSEARKKVQVDFIIQGLLTNGSAQIATDLLRKDDPKQIVQLIKAAFARLPAKKGQGRGKLYPDESAGPDALGYCALIVSVALQRATGVWPGPTRHAMDICELLWRYAGGDRHNRHDKPGRFSTWRRHLVAATHYYLPHDAGAFVDRSLDRILQKLAYDRGCLPTPSISGKGRMRRFYNHPRSIAVQK